MEDDLRTARLVHISFMLAAAGFLPLALRFESQGTHPVLELDGGALWLMRAALFALAIAGLATLRLIGPHAAGLRRAPSWSTFGAPVPGLVFLRMSYGLAIAIYGVLVHLIGGHIIDVASFVSVSLAVLAWLFPRHSNWPLGTGEEEPGLG
jgi:hypothetical protein